MKICVKCPQCNNQILLPDWAADRRITCTKCLNLFKVPALEELSQALSVIEKTAGGVFVDEKGNCLMKDYVSPRVNGEKWKEMAREQLKQSKLRFGDKDQIELVKVVTGDPKST